MELARREGGGVVRSDGGLGLARGRLRQRPGGGGVVHAAIMSSRGGACASGAEGGRSRRHGGWGSRGWWGGDASARTEAWGSRGGDCVSDQVGAESSTRRSRAREGELARPARGGDVAVLTDGGAC